MVDAYSKITEVFFLSTQLVLIRDRLHFLPYALVIMWFWNSAIEVRETFKTTLDDVEIALCS